MKIQLIYLTLLVAVGWSGSGCSNSSEAFLKKGRELLQQGNAEGSLEFLNKAIDKDAANYEALNTRGVAYFELKRYEDARLDYEQAVRLKPDFYKPHYNLGRNAIAQQNWPQALENFSAAIKLAPDTADCYFNRGNVYYELNQFPQALKDFSQAILLNPRNYDYYYNRGTTRLRVQDMRGAMDDFRRSIEINPRFAKGYFTLGLQEIISKQPDQGCEHLKQAETLGYPEAAKERAAYCLSTPTP